ncbi:MAG: hypothetical protein GEU75_11895 [Dehalococcoidia bacterium]|nr:hypothetical protein [Dehalococcoidia bacterium]
MTGQRGAMFILIGFAGLLLVIAVFSGWQGASRLSDRSDDSAAVEDAARTFVEAFGTFDYRAPERHRERLLLLSTGSVLAVTANSAVDPVAVGQRRVTSTHVVSSSVSALSVDGAAVSVTAEQIRRGTDPESGEAIEEYVLQRVNCRLVSEDNRWLVAEFRLLSEEPLK